MQPSFDADLKFLEVKCYYNLRNYSFQASFLLAGNTKTGNVQGTLIIMQSI